MKTLLTALTRPRTASGVHNCMMVSRIETLTISQAPTSTSAGTATQIEVESPKIDTIVAACTNYVARRLIEATGRPVAAPSANRSGHVSPTTAAHVAEDLGSRIDLILDGGACPVGVESTIIACLDGPPRLLRPGGVSREAAEAILGCRLEAPEGFDSDRPLAPGLLASHYAPRALVRLGVTQADPDEAVLDFAGQLAGVPCLTRLDLSQRGDLIEAAAQLFGFLRQLDASGAQRIAVAPIPETGLGEAINDRLRRAAATR